jgi:hypothetical protein
MFTKVIYHTHSTNPNYPKRFTMQGWIYVCEYMDGHLSEQGGTIDLDGAPGSVLVFKVINYLNTSFDCKVLDTCLVTSQR